MAQRNTRNSSSRTEPLRLRGGARATTGSERGNGTVGRFRFQHQQEQQQQSTFRPV